MGKTQHPPKDGEVRLDRARGEPVVELGSDESEEILLADLAEVPRAEV